METPTKKQKQKLLKLGYSEVMIRNIPAGTVLNKDNWDNFPLISSNTFMHEDKIRQIDYYNDSWRMLYVTNKSSLNGKQIISTTLDELIKNIISYELRTEKLNHDDYTIKENPNTVVFTSDDVDKLYFEEVWQPTMNLRWLHDVCNRNMTILQQEFISNKGNSKWHTIPTFQVEHKTKKK